MSELDQASESCSEQINHLWIQLSAELPTLEKVVFYVGSSGAERAIELAAQNGLTPDRAVFVLCDCNLHMKESLISSYGFSTSQMIMCECGGHDTMHRIYHTVLGRGHI